MSAELPAILATEDNYILLDQACMLLRAADDILLNECSELFHLAYACKDEGVRGHVLNQLNLLYVGVSRAYNILQALSKADRATWAP